MRYTAEFCDREYNARASIPDNLEIFDRWAARSLDVRRRAAGVFDLPYGRSPAERLDLFPAAAPAAPLFVFIHGGYWRALDKSDFSFLAPAFVRAGISLAIPNYALAPKVTVEEITRQMLGALAWLYRNGHAYGCDRHRIVVGGHSAGGHLSAMMMCALWPQYAPDLPTELVRGALAISGLYDLEPIRHTTFLNPDLGLDRRRALRLSPAWMPPASDAPLVTAVGGLESSEFHRQNRLIAERWPRNFRYDVPMPGHHHLSVCEALGEDDSALFAAARELCDW
ncbi:MAG: alpha/beta hydrolase [Burkholderiales bacterium]|nr:MAG: alpha/beta hydrolase [Burkholderiales bacterium]